MPVLIHIDAAETSPVDAAAMVEACSRSARPDACGLTRDPASSSARVRWHEDGVSVEVRHGQAWIANDMQFSPQDSLHDRSVAVGLVIGALWRERQENARESPPPADKPPISSSEAVSRPRALTVALQSGVFATTGLISGLGFGPFGQVSVVSSVGGGRLGFGAGADWRTPDETDEARIDWLSGQVHLHLTWPLSHRWRLGAQIGGHLEAVWATATVTGEEEQRRYFALSTGAISRFHVWQGWFVALELQAILRPEIEIWLGEERLGGTKTLGTSLRAGFGVEL